MDIKVGDKVLIDGYKKGVITKIARVNCQVTNSFTGKVHSVPISRVEKVRSHLLNSALEIKGINSEWRKEVVEFIQLLNDLSMNTSRNGGYDRLDEWSSPVNDFIHKKLNKYKFVSGDPEANKKLPDASFWWALYPLPTSIIHSVHLETKFANHHASAFERNEALICELKELLNRRED
jgi:hypothetical protein